MWVLRDADLWAYRPEVMTLSILCFSSQGHLEMCVGDGESIEDLV